ncbi:MAG: hypothetical protein II032_06910 [Treponema sp.]|nr:hypothetical protein [Treponema sp.]
MCPSCVHRLENEIENDYEDFKQGPNNYLNGIIAAFLFSILGIIVTFLFLLMGKIASVSGLVYFYLAQKGKYGSGFKSNW